MREVLYLKQIQRDSIGNKLARSKVFSKLEQNTPQPIPVLK